MDHDEAPRRDALAYYHRLGRYGFTPPAHRQGAGADPRTRAVLGHKPFRSDVLGTAGLDDRSSPGESAVPCRAEALLADAVGAEQAQSARQ